MRLRGDAPEVFVHPDTPMSLSPDVIEELRRSLHGVIRVDRTSRILYSTDASIYQIEPLGVVIPRDQDDLQAAVEIAARHGVPVLPRGSGSSLAGQAIGEALILDCSRWLDHVLDINPEACTATVEPGVILASLNKALAIHGLQFGPDPASAERATMGGVIANNATGAHSIRYGMTADHLRHAEVVTSDGSLADWGQVSVEALSGKGDGTRMDAVLAAVGRIRSRYADAIRDHYPRSWRNSAGYRLNYLLPWSPGRPPQWDGDTYPDVPTGSVNLAPLLAGSEGTLAVIRKATLNLVPRPKHTILAVLGYAGIDAACDDVPRLLGCGPSAIELIPRSIVRLARSVPAYAAQAAILDMDAEALLVVEFSGDHPAELVRAAQALSPSLIAEAPADQARIWNVRKVGLGLLASRTGDAKTVAFIEDCAIPVDQLGSFVRGLEGVLRDYGVSAEYYAHASAGCLHIRPILDLKRNVKALRGIGEAAVGLTLSLGGSLSSEHGDGLARSEWLRRTYGAEVMEAFRELKRSADPQGIFNPGKILDAPPMDENLRFGEGYRTHAWVTSLDFKPEGGLEGAIEQCNGQGVCRKFDGTMCPSFQATREEANSTRGRANLLRAMISRGPEEALLEEAHQALDLCLACKGCKSECPSGVDMAKLKYAFESEYYKTHRRQLRDYIFGYFHTVSSVMTLIAPLANAIMKFPPTRRLIAKMTGITPHRPFPAYSSLRTHVRIPKVDPPVGTVLFLPDAFTHFIEPQVEQAAFDLLASAGYEVKVLPIVGAGASLLSKGFIEAAQRHAARVLDCVKKADPDGKLQVIGLEPPEVSMLKHDIGALLPERKEEGWSLASRIWLTEEFLLRNRINDLRVVISDNAPQSIKQEKLRFQPHCHQRAEPSAPDGLPAGANATVALLNACGFSNVELIDSGCCGMAGTFGYEAEHYELSRAVGELKLLPYVRKEKALDPSSKFLASGSACRLQIEQGAETDAEHPLVLLVRYLHDIRPRR